MTGGMSGGCLQQAMHLGQIERIKSLGKLTIITIMSTKFALIQKLLGHPRIKVPLTQFLRTRKF